MATSTMQTILIIGGTSGIGLAFAHRLQAMNKTVIITGRRTDRLSALATSDNLQTFRLDFDKVDTLPSGIDEIFTRWPDIDTVFLNAGLQYASDIKDLGSSSDERVKEEVGVNVTSPMVFARHAVPKLLACAEKSKKPTTLMFNSSGLGFVPVGKLFPVYCATKAAIHHYAVGLRQALQGTGVNVVEIVPPYVEGTEIGPGHRDMLKGMTGMSMGDFVDEVFGVLDEKEAGELKEVSAGSGVPRVEAWRAGTGRILDQGLGG